MAERMLVDLAFFKNDDLLCRATIRIEDHLKSMSVEGPAGLVFLINYRFEEPACPINVVCEQNGKVLYEGALRMGVHASNDWESINLANIHDLGFRCHLA